MKYPNIWRVIGMTIVMTLTFILVSCQKDQPTDPTSSASTNQTLDKNGNSLTAGSFSIFATGLNNPRGLKFGPDGFLYVAEGGIGGNDSTIGKCEQVPFPVGPYKGSPAGARISKISPAGVRSTYADGFPSSGTNPASGGDISGVSDVGFIHGQLYALIGGAGCSHGLEGTYNGIAKVNSNGSWNLIANLSNYVQTHPVAHPEADDFEPDGTPYSMVVVDGNFYVVEPNHGSIEKVTPHGSIERVIDVSATQGHVVPTSIAYHKNFYVGNLGTFPIAPGTEHIYRITKHGKIKIKVDSLTTVLGVAFDERGSMYALEMSTMPGFPSPGTGQIVRIKRSGKFETIATGLTFPTAMTFGPDGALYVSNNGFGFPAGAGQIVRIGVPSDKGGHDQADEGDDQDGKDSD